MATRTESVSKDALSLSQKSASSSGGPVRRLVGAGVAALSPVVRDTLQAQAYNKLREALMTGVIAPGQNLTLRATAEVMGTSPMPVRDAVRRLEIEHALVARSNRTLGVPEMTYASLIELRDVRVMLEGMATERAALRITAEELVEIEGHYHELAAAAEAGDSSAYLRANWAFHLAIYRASRLQLVVSMIEPTWMRIGPYVRLMLPDRGSLVESLGNHLHALDALRRHDPAAARQAISQDILNSAERLANLLRIRESPKDKRGIEREGRPPRRKPLKRAPSAR